MVIEAILFDKDGVLIDFDRTWGAWGSRLIDRLADGDDVLAGELASALLYDRDRSVFLPASPIIAGTSDTWIKLVAPVVPTHTQEQLIEEAIAALKATAAVAPVDLVSVLGELRAAGFHLGIATNDSEQSAKRQMTEFGVVDVFDCIFGYDSGYGAKPEPGMQLAFAEQIGVSPERIVMVGDSTHDLAAGAAAGMVCVGVLTGPAGLDVLSSHAHTVLPDIAHLHDWLRAEDV